MRWDVSVERDLPSYLSCAECTFLGSEKVSVGMNCEVNLEKLYPSLVDNSSDSSGGIRKSQLRGEALVVLVVGIINKATIFKIVA
jgi:hypothetical protein